VLIKTAKKMNMPALALTDNGNMYGTIEFYKDCKKKELKPIIGIDMYVAVRSRNDKQGGIDNRRTRLVLLAKDNTGYHNLIVLTTLAHTEGFYYKPRIDKELIEKYHDGLIAIAPSFSSDITGALKVNDFAKAKDLITWYKGIYGADNFYLEVTHHPEIENHEGLTEKIIKIARETDTQIVAAHDVYYMNPEDRTARDTLMLVNTNGDLSDRHDDDESDFSFISPERANELFADTPDALDNTQKIADACNVTLDLGKWTFPNFIIESGRNADDELRVISYEGIEKRGLERTEELLTRLEYELKVIKDKGYSPYFLVVGDLLKFAHENGILTNIRGSVGGSLVTFLVEITNVNPLEYKLPFERFLNPERPSAPDIDMDYADNRRDDVINYARQKYGVEHVAQIGTFGTMAARGAVRDVARAMGFPYATADRISKLIPMGAQGAPMTIDKALEDVAELRQMYDNEPDTKKIIDMAKKIEGCARHISVHAAGVVISPTALTDFTPLQYDTKGENKIITQYDMHAVEDAGLLKFDFLGIKNLAILADAVSLANKLENKNIEIEKVPIDDKKTFEMLARGETCGLFQLNGDGMTKYLKELKPSTIHDINAMVALYRPGPLEMIPEYIKRKHNAKYIKYLDPRLKDILDMSFGVITYQDDVMLIAIKLAGYSWLEADKLRKAMGKKVKEEMDAQKDKLHKGFIEHGLTEEKAQTLWQLIVPFASYGFNKAHAASYGRVAYQTAYMKANYPAIYMSAVLTADSGDVEKIGEFIAECKRMGIPVLPPDVNESFSNFTVVRKSGDLDTIRFGLTTIKNFGEGIAKAIIEERKTNGRFKDISDFLMRVKDHNLNKKSLEALIKAGAMDEFGERGELLANLEAMLAHNKDLARGGAQDSLFGLFEGNDSPMIFKMKPAPEIQMADKLAWEKELLGLYLSGHPLDKYRDVMEKQNNSILKLKTEFEKEKDILFAGIVQEVREIVTKKGDPMAFVKIADFTDSIDTVVFPKIFTQYKGAFQVDKCLAIKGKISKRNDELSVIIDKVKVLGQTAEVPKE
jgi:DNA polymerase-3 subunit alpha